jgi:hypothetical protein
MMVSDKEMAPQEQPLLGTRPTERLETVDAKESSVFPPREASEDHHPHACTDGLVFLSYTVFDEAVGEEVERLEVVPCRRCAANLS